MIVQEYFQSHKNYFWQWEDNAEVIAIPEYNTICYQAFIKQVLKHLSDQGLPPFGALLAAIIATNPGGAGALDFLFKKFEEEAKKEGNHYLMDAFVFLKLLSEIPDQYKKGNKRILIFQAIFEHCHNVNSIKNSKEIIQWYDSNATNYILLTEKKEIKHTIYSRDFRTISLLNTRYRSVEDILKKIASLPEITEVIIPQEDSNNRGNSKQTFIEALIAENKTFQIGILAERIMSGLNIPFHRSLAEQQPLGGISDITNKGSFDKLLLSEFANEEILFLSRLANNEALYIEREIPPANNKLKRVFLIDTSLRTWGTPKSIAFATMLAMAKAPVSKVESSAYAIGRSYKLIEIDTIDTIIDALQILEGSADASDGLSLYFKENPPDKNTEIFLLTESSSARLASMHRCMAIHSTSLNYYIHTDAEGNIDVFKKQQKSVKHVQHIQLPLEELLKKKPVLTKPNFRTESVTTYPILVRNATHVRQQLVDSKGDVYHITGEKALVKKYDCFADKHVKGWQIIEEDIPFSDGILEMVELNNGDQLLFIYSFNKKMIFLLNIHTKNRISIVFNEYGHPAYSSYKEFIYLNEHFYHKNGNDVWRIGIDGTVQLIKPIDIDTFVFTAKKAPKQAFDKQYSQGAFKNINEIYINEDNSLVFNVHQLQIKSNAHIKLDKATNTIKVTASTKTSQNEFVFNDGSSIEVNRSGLLILKSSNEAIPLIYMPAVIDSTLGVAAGDEFAGNLYYYKDPLFKIILTDPGKQPLSVVKYIQEKTYKDLSDAKNIIDSWPSCIIQSVNETRANEIQKELQALGASTKAEKMDKMSMELNKITASLFYEKYIQAFINVIQSYGAKN